MLPFSELKKKAPEGQKVLRRLKRAKEEKQNATNGNEPQISSEKTHKKKIQHWELIAQLKRKEGFICGNTSTCECVDGETHAHPDLNVVFYFIICHFGK